MATVALATAAAALAALSEGTSALRRSDNATALKAFDRAVAASPKHAVAHYRRGIALKRLGRIPEARGALRAAAEHAGKTDPRTTSRALYGVAIIEQASLDFQAARTAWNAYLRFARPLAAEKPYVAVAERELAACKRHLDRRKKTGETSP